MRHPRHHQTAERRRCTGPLQCDVIDDTIKMLNDDAALELFAWIIVALVAVVSCVRKTNICFIFVCFLDALPEYEAITTLSPGGLLSGARIAALPGRHRPGLLRRRRAARDSADIVAAGPCGVKKHAIHDYVCLVCGRWFCSSRWDGGCCAWAAALVVLVVRQRSGWCARASKTHATNSSFH